MRRLASFALVLAMLSAAPASADPPVDMEGTFETVDTVMEVSCGAMHLCLPPWYPGPDIAQCPIYASLAPGVPGVVDIDGEGDVSISGRKVQDCPPYEVGPRFDLSDTYMATVQRVCEVGVCAPPPLVCEVWDCTPIDPAVVAGQVVGQVLDPIFAILAALCEADVCPLSSRPLLCPFFARLSPGPLPEVVIGPDGDVAIGGRPVYTCPPYG